MAPRKDIEATISSYQNYAKGNVTGSTRNHPYSVVGKTGKYNQAFDVYDGTMYLTGSRSGVCGVNVLAHGSAILHLAGGGSVAAIELESDNGYIAELAIVKVTAASTAGITLYR